MAVAISRPPVVGLDRHLTEHGGFDSHASVSISQARGFRRAVARPALGGDREGLLRGFLGALEVAEEAVQGGEDPAPLSRNVSSGDRYRSVIGRTSIAPPSLAAGIRAASSIAASRSSASYST